MPGLLTKAVSMTRRVVKDFLRDEGVRELVTYRSFAGQSFSTTLGYNVDTYNDTTDLKTLRLKADEQQLARLGMVGEVEAGAVMFLVDCQELTEVSVRDRIVDKIGNIYKVTSFRDLFQIVYVIACEGESR